MGTKVFADGKWLQCIGNKRVLVGDKIWTDGRCVYGYTKISQQPLVITAPQEDEGIPLAAFSQETTKRADLYTFEKNRVRKVAEIRLENGDANIYNFVSDKLVFSRTLPNTDKWTNYTIFINDGKKNSRLYDRGTHYKAGFYNSTSWSNPKNNFYTDTELIACNVDNSGNRFDMVIRYKSSWNEDDEKEIKATAVEILKNGEVVQSVSLGKIFDDVIAATPNTEQLWTPAEMNSYGVTVSNRNLPVCAFIENERMWAFWFDCLCEKGTFFNDDPAIDTEQTGWEMHSGVQGTALRQLRLITANEQKIISQTSGITYATVDYSSVPFVKYDSTLTMNHISSRATIPLQDGFYCTVHDIFTTREVLGLEIEYINELVYGYITHFSPRGEELFSGIFSLPYTAQICKVHNKYLFNHDCGAPFLGDETPDVYNGVSVFESGLFLITKNTCERIDNTFSNERLRPMKNIRGWQNRIGNIELQQKEI